MKKNKFSKKSHSELKNQSIKFASNRTHNSISFTAANSFDEENSTNKKNSPSNRQQYRLDSMMPLTAFHDVKKNREGEIIAIKSTIENLKVLFNNYQISCRYNELTKRAELKLPGYELETDNHANAAISRVKSIALRVGMPKSEVAEYITAIADETYYHPVKDWIKSVVWDGKDRLNELADTIIVSDEYIIHRNTLLKRWLISTVAALFSENENDKFELVLVFQGAQGAGKTSWFKRLCPQIKHAIQDGISLNPDQKDSVLAVIKHWIVELGELDGTFKQADIAKLKAFISKTHDEVRLHYAHRDSTFKRRTVLCASVNNAKFLIDNTGNRRWCTIPIKNLIYDHDIDTQQVFAQVFELYKAKESWHLTIDESNMLSKLNGEHELIIPAEELICAEFEFDKLLDKQRSDCDEYQLFFSNSVTVKLTASKVVLGLGLQLNKRNTNEVAALLRKYAACCEKRNGKFGTYFQLIPKNLEKWKQFAL